LLSNAEEMRHKLIKLFQQIEIISGQILKHGIIDESAESSASSSGEARNSVNQDQIKLQRNIRFYAINFLKENSFTLSTLPAAEEYAKLKSQRQIYLAEEMRRTELELAKQKQALNNQVAKRLMKSSHNNKKNVKNAADMDRNSTNAIVSIDNSNGWVPSVPSVKGLLEESDNETGGEEEAKEEINEDRKSVSSKKSYTAPNEQEKALRIQIQLVEQYLRDAVKQNKQEEAAILQRNLNELLNTLVNK
jgi:hypothetical protein